MTAWKQAPIVDNDEKLVPIGPFSGYPHLLSSAIYAGERVDSPYFPDGLPGAVLTPFVREGVARRLDEMARALPKGLHVLVWDSYRSIETQSALYSYYEQQLIAEHPEWSADRISAQAQRFVSLPSRNPDRPSPHNTGAVIDLTLVHMNHGPSTKLEHALRAIARARAEGDWKREYQAHVTIMHVVRSQSTPLEMGTAFDEVASATLTDHYTHNPPVVYEDRRAAANRNFLRARMEHVGFHAYEDEWWHFSFGDQMWAHANGTTACYGRIELSAENQEFEARRRIHHRRQRAWADGTDIAGLVPERYTRAAAFARELTPRFSDPRHSDHPDAHRL